MAIIGDPSMTLATLATAQLTDYVHSAQPGSPVVIEPLRTPRVERPRRVIASLLAAAARKVEPVDRRQVACVSVR